MNRNNPVVQALLGNKNKQGNQPQQNECVDEHGKKAKTSTVEGCAANKHGGVHSCESQGKEIIWAKVQQKTSLYPCNYQKNPIEYDHAIADGGVFTYDKTTITVAGGCRANFLICYKGMYIRSCIAARARRSACAQQTIFHGKQSSNFDAFLIVFR